MGWTADSLVREVNGGTCDFLCQQSEFHLKDRPQSEYGVITVKANRHGNSNGLCLCSPDIALLFCYRHPLCRGRATSGSAFAAVLLNAGTAPSFP